jgi:hypothetical protein
VKCIVQRLRNDCLDNVEIGPTVWLLKPLYCICKSYWLRYDLHWGVAIIFTCRVRFNSATGRHLFITLLMHKFNPINVLVTAYVWRFLFQATKEANLSLCLSIVRDCAECGSKVSLVMMYEHWLWIVRFRLWQLLSGRSKSNWPSNRGLRQSQRRSGCET